MQRTYYFFILLISLVQISGAQTASRMFEKDANLATRDSFRTGIDFYASWQNSALTLYETNNDPLHYIVSPFLHYKFNPSIVMNVRVNVENIRDEYLFPEKTYWGDEFAGHRGGIEIGMIKYQSKWFDLHFGRDFFIPGKRFYEGLLFSEYNYSYDQIRLALHSKQMEISSFYLDLTDWPTGAGQAQRYLFGHRFTWKFAEGYFAFNDVMLYGGVKRQFKPALFNPFILFYPYQKNRGNVESNSLMSFELYIPWNSYVVFAEFLIDDYQVDKKVPGDLEPNEWGVNITVGKNEIFKNSDWKMNYTRVANRTFNAPEKEYEKYIYKNLPIGHFLGNNFWELKSTLNTRWNERLVSELTVYHGEFGDEALYGAFNKDYFNYTVEQGYSERFPFGTIKTQSGLVFGIDYTALEEVHFKGKMSYWLHNPRLKDSFNFLFAMHYRLNILKHRPKF